jgi:hypothetical protein
MLAMLQGKKVRDFAGACLEALPGSVVSPPLLCKKSIAGAKEYLILHSNLPWNLSG